MVTAPILCERHRGNGVLILCLLLAGIAWRPVEISADSAGVSTIGTANYPDGGMALAPPFTGLKNENYASCGFVNAAGTQAWIGMNTTYGNFEDFPGVIVAMDLTNMTKPATLQLAAGERGVIGAVGDPTSTFGYFLVDNNPARIVKVQLATMTRVAAVDLAAGEIGGSMTGDKTGTYAYVGLMGSPGKVVRINLADFTRSATLTLPAADANLTGAKVDNAGQFAYFLSYTVPDVSRIIKVRLSDFTRANSLPLPAGKPADIAFDVANPARVYVAQEGVQAGPPPPFPTGKICRVNLDESTIDTLENQDLRLRSVTMSLDGTRALIGYAGGTLQFLDVAQFQFLSTKFPAPPGGGGLGTVLTVSHSPETVLILNNTIPAVLMKGSYQDDTAVARSPLAVLEGAEDSFQSITQDEDQRYLYAGTSRTKLVKFDLARRKRVAGVQMGLDGMRQTSIATSGPFVYTANFTNPLAVRRVDAQSMQVLTTATDFGGGNLEDLAFHPFNGGIYAILNSFGGTGSLGFADPFTLSYSGLFAVPSPVRLGALTPNRNDTSFYYINAYSALVTYWQNGTFTYSEPLLGGPKSLLRGAYGSLYAVTGNSVFELNPQSLAILRSQNLQSLAGSSTLALTGGASDGVGSFGLYHGTDGLGVNAQPILFKHSLNDFSQYSFRYLPFSLKKVLLNHPGTRAVGLTEKAETLLRVSLTPRERMEGTRVRLNQNSQINSTYFYAHAAVGPRRVEALPHYDHTQFISGFVDRAHNTAWFGTGQSPGHVVSFDPVSRDIVSSLTLQSGEDGLECAAVDPTGTFGYFGTFTGPARVVKVRLANATREEMLTLDPGENNLRAAAIDPAGTFAYFADANSPAHIIQVRLSPTFTRVGALTLEADEGSVRDLAISPNGQYLYVACATNPGKIVRIQLSDFTRVGVLTLDPGENQTQALAIHPDGAFMYAACATFPSIIVKIRLSNFTHEAALPLNSGEENAMGLALSSISNCLLVACGADPPVVARINLTTFKREAAGALRRDTEVNLKPILFDNAGRFAFLGTNTAPGRIVTFEAAPKPLRLGIYAQVNDHFARLWQSPPLPVTAPASWIALPINQGSPSSLNLSAGNYLLAWQFDADEPGPSYAPGQMGDGIQLPLEYGSFPDTLSPTDAGTSLTETSSRWSMYLDYTSKNAARDWENLP